MKFRKIVIGAALLVVGLPAVLVVAGAVSISVMNRTNGTIVSSGQKREYLLHVPPGYDRTRPTPLVISLHGAMNWPALQMRVSQWNRVADENGFLVVYPSGTGAVGKIWFMEGARTPSRMPDVRFIAELIDTLEAAYNIDATRIYASGFSNGGGMTFVLSCTLADRIAAFGAVSAAQYLPWSWCPDSQPVPMIAFHGTADRIVSYDGGRVLPVSCDRARRWGVLLGGCFAIHLMRFPSVMTWVANWARRNRCGPSPVDAAVAADVTRREYAGCADSAAVVLYTIQGGGHQWPGGKPLPQWIVGPASGSIEATRLMWAFFREHPLVRT